MATFFTTVSDNTNNLIYTWNDYNTSFKKSGNGFRDLTEQWKEWYKRYEQIFSGRIGEHQYEIIITSGLYRNQCHVKLKIEIENDDHPLFGITGEAAKRLFVDEFLFATIESNADERLLDLRTTVITIFPLYYNDFNMAYQKASKCIEEIVEIMENYRLEYS